LVMEEYELYYKLTKSTKDEYWLKKSTLLAEITS